MKILYCFLTRGMHLQKVLEKVTVRKSRVLEVVMR